MRKVETVRVPERKARPATTRKVEKIFCDFCSASLPKHGSYGWIPKCSLCKRDCCQKHTIPDASDSSDYPDYFCPNCHYLKFTKFAERYNEIERQYDLAINNLEKEIKEASLKMETNNV